MSDKTLPLTDVEACVFDAYGTLLDVMAAANQCRDVLGDKTEPLATVWREKQLEYTWLRSLMGRFEDFWHVTGAALDYAMTSVEIADPALRARLMDLYLKLKAYDEVQGVLSKLRDKGMRTAILSNASVTMLTAAARSAGILELMDRIFSVDELKIFKPHPSTYQLAVDGLHLPPEKICFLSSNPWDVAGASAFGYRVVWVNRAGRQPEQLPWRAEREIQSLGELPALVCG